jgi:Putative addiction module component
VIEDPDDPIDPDVDAAWAAEIQRRSREIDEGAVKCIPAAEVFEKIFTQIKKGNPEINGLMDTLF